MPKLDLAAIPETNKTGYPPPFDALVAGRRKRNVDRGLTDFGANLTTLAPGAMSSLRHWHSAVDEQSIPHDQAAVRRAPERYMSDRVPRRVQPRPPWQSRHGRIRRQRVQSCAHVDRRAWKQGRQQRHQPATHMRVGGRVGGGAHKIRMLERMCIHRHVPFCR